MAERLALKLLLAGRDATGDPHDLVSYEVEAWLLSKNCCSTAGAA